MLKIEKSLINRIRKKHKLPNNLYYRYIQLIGKYKLC